MGIVANTLLRNCYFEFNLAVVGNANASFVVTVRRYGAVTLFAIGMVPSSMLSITHNRENFNPKKPLFGVFANKMRIFYPYFDKIIC